MFLYTGGRRFQDALRPKRLFWPRLAILPPSGTLLANSLLTLSPQTTRNRLVQGEAGEKEIQRLLRERERLRTALIKANGGKPIRLTAVQQASLDALRKKLDPELAKKYDLLADYE
jgi:hypothetical protein